MLTLVFFSWSPTANKLLNRPDVICTPHMGASTMEAQEGVSIEVVEAVVDALQGKLSANAVNAPMVRQHSFLKLLACHGSVPDWHWRITNNCFEWWCWMTYE